MGPAGGVSAVPEIDEAAVVAAVVAGRSDREIAAALGASARRVRAARIAAGYVRGPAEGETPWVLSVPWADVRLCALPDGIQPRHLRGAVCGALDRLAGGTYRSHVDWHNHAEGDETRAHPPTICYRVRGGVGWVHLCGPRVRERLAELGRVRALELPNGDVIEVHPTIESGETPVSLSRRNWYGYELVSPLFPPGVSYKNRPREEGPARVAWAGRLLRNSIVALMQSWGFEPEKVPSVQVIDYRDERVSWARPERGEGYDFTGFRARFYVDAVLPPGVGLGQHRAEGFGEVRPWG